MAAMQVMTEAPVATAESSLLELFGQSGNITVAPAQSASSTNADAVARDLSTGDIQNNVTAGAIVRERVEPPPSSPR